MKKLLITTDCFPPRWDGVARFLVDMIPALRKKFKVTVVAPAFEGSFVVKGVRVIRLPLMPWQVGDIHFSYPQYRKIRELVNESDVVFNQTIGPIGLCAILAASRRRKRIVSFVHSMEWELAAESVRFFKMASYYAVRALARRLYARCSLLLVPSRQVVKVLVNAGISTRMNIVPLGVDVRKFSPGNRAVAKKRLGVGVEELVIGFCGRLGREKDIPTLCSAFKRVQSKFKVRLLIVGAGLDVPECKGENIVITGFVNDVRQYLHAMDVFVLPSLTETSSLVTMEAMACGLPVVVTPVGAIPEYVREGVNGVFFPKGDVNVLEEKLVRLLSSSGERVRLGRNARKSMIKSRNWSETVRKVLSELKV